MDKPVNAIFSLYAFVVAVKTRFEETFVVDFETQISLLSTKAFTSCCLGNNYQYHMQSNYMSVHISRVYCKLIHGVNIQVRLHFKAKQT